MIPDDELLWTETFANTQCDIIMQIFKEQYCAFSWLSVASWLLTMHGMNITE